MAASVTVEGVPGVQERLRAIARQVGARVIEDAAMDAADVMVDEMRSRINVHTGRTRAGIDKQLKEREGNHVVVWVGATQRRFVARFLEFGTRKMSAKPWARPALAAARGRVQDRFLASVRSAMQRIAGALR